MAPLRIGTRGSALALAQARQVAALIEAAPGGGATDVVSIATTGDRDRAGAEDKRRWVAEIEQALLDGEIDLAVHSAKDVPGELASGLELAGSPARADPRDALCGAGTLSELEPGARVGTGSPRRASQLLALREDIEVVELHGNVDTRLRRLREARYRAIVIALAGLQRLGREDEAGAALDVAEVVPAPGQGILALEARMGDERARSLARAVSDPATLAALSAERALVSAIGASCHTPVGAHAAPLRGGRLELRAFVGLPDGSAWISDRVEGPAASPPELGRRGGERLLSAGAGDLLARAELMAVGRA